MGVKTGMAIWQAKQRCEDLIVVPPHYSEYVRYSGFVREIFEYYTDQVNPLALMKVGWMLRGAAACSEME